YEHTRNSRMPEGLAGGTAGKYDTKASQKNAAADMNAVTLHSEVSLPFDQLVKQNLTMGNERAKKRKKDQHTKTQNFMGGKYPG
ncbi:hypothetical protein AIZ15_24555, partial [Salmonella enterica subsp. enterica serovar Typhimurium]